MLYHSVPCSRAVTPTHLKILSGAAMVSGAIQGSNASMQSGAVMLLGVEGKTGVLGSHSGIRTLRGAQNAIGAVTETGTMIAVSAVTVIRSGIFGDARTGILIKAVASSPWMPPTIKVGTSSWLQGSSGSEAALMWPGPAVPGYFPPSLWLWGDGGARRINKHLTASYASAVDVSARVKSSVWLTVVGGSICTELNSSSFWAGVNGAS